MSAGMRENLSGPEAGFKLSLQGKILRAQSTETRLMPEANSTAGTYDWNNTKSVHLFVDEKAMNMEYGEAVHIRLGLTERINIIHPVLGVLECLDSDEKARAFGLTPHKLVLVLMCGINPTLSLDEISFINFLNDEGSQKVSDQLSATSLQAGVGQPGKDLPEIQDGEQHENLIQGFSGTPVCLDFRSTFELEQFTRGQTIEEVVASISKALKSTEMVKEALFILLNYLTYLAKKESQDDMILTSKGKERKITKFLTAAIGFKDVLETCRQDTRLADGKRMTLARKRLHETILERRDDFQRMTVELQLSAQTDGIFFANESSPVRHTGRDWLLCIDQHASFSATAIEAIENLQYEWYKKKHELSDDNYFKNYEIMKKRLQPHSSRTQLLLPEINGKNRHKRKNVFFNACRSYKDPKRVLVINTSTDNMEYAKWVPVINLIMSDGYVKTDLEAALCKQPAIIETLEQSDLEQEDLDTLQNTAISKPPAFVNDDCKPDIMTDPLGIQSAKYVGTIKAIFKSLTSEKITAAKGDGTKKTSLTTDISKVLADFLDNVLVSTKDGHLDDVTYNITTKKGGDMKQTKTGKAGLKHQLTITLASIFTCIKNKTKFATHGSLVWTFDRMQPKVKKLVDIKVDADLPSPIDIVIILNSKKSQRDTHEARILMNEKLLSIGKTEEPKITKEDDKKSYTTQVLPEVRKYVEKHFKNKLRKEDASGITAIRSLLKSVDPNSRILEILTFLHEEAGNALDMKALTEHIDERTSDGEDVILPVCNHKCKLVEPPSFSEACRTIHKFSPPTYFEEKHGDFIDFVEGTAMTYMRKFPSMSFADKGIALWWLFKSERQKNMFMKSFGKFLNDVSISNEKEFQNLYVQVSKKMFPEQIKTPLHYQDLLNDTQWLVQREGEVFDELLERLKDCLENAFPNEHTSDVNRVRLADTFYKALNNRFYQKFIDDYYYEDFFYKGKMNLVITQLNKKKKIRLEQKRRNEHHVTSVRAVNKKNIAPGHRNHPTTENRQDFRLGGQIKDRAKPGRNRGNMTVSFVKKNDDFQRNKFSDSRKETFRSGQYPHPGKYDNANRGNHSQQSRHHRDNFRQQTRFKPNGEWKPRREESGFNKIKPWENVKKSFGSNNSSMDKPPSDLKKEITFLTRNKNLKPNGGFWVELNQIDEKISNAPGFDIRNFVPEKQWKTTVNQAKDNLRRKMESRKDSRDQAVRTRRNKRKTRSMHRRQNVVINRREVNRVRANVYAISASKCHEILRLKKSKSTAKDKTATDSYRIMVSCGNSDTKTTVKAIIDSGAGVNLMGIGIFQKIKSLGTFHDISDLEAQPQLRGASNDELNVTGAIVVDLNFGHRTTYEKARILVSDSVPSNFFVLGTEFLTDLKLQLSFMFAPVFHRVDCQNIGFLDVSDDCTEDCAETKNSMIISPHSIDGCDIVKFMPSDDDHVRFLEQYETLIQPEAPKDLRMGTFHTASNQAIGIRFVSLESTTLAPNSMKFVEVDAEEETWSPKADNFAWEKMTADEKDLLVVASPTNFLETCAGMDGQNEEGIYSVKDNIYLVKNHTDRKIKIGSGTALANCLLIE